MIHAEIRIGNSVVMISEDAGDASAPARSPHSLGRIVSAVMATYWDDVDAAWERAVAAGAEVVYPLADQFYGERGGRLRDPLGQQWMLSQHIEEPFARGDETTSGRVLRSSKLMRASPTINFDNDAPRPLLYE